MKNRCGQCVAFGTHFCPFYNAFLNGALLPDDEACSDFWSIEQRLKVTTVKKKRQGVIMEVARIDGNR